MKPRMYPPGTVRALLDTDHVTGVTRDVLQSRLAALTAPATPTRFFDTQTFQALRAACARLIPQSDRSCLVDLARQIDQRLADGDGNGWRYDSLPPDGEAYRRGLRGLDESADALFGQAFTALDGPRQDQVLAAVQRGDAPGEIWATMPPDRFFEELLAELCEWYYSDPLSQEEIGYVGMADASGWQEVGLNQLMPHEPRALDVRDGRDG